ncbi:MAG: winged helix-turn-helix domain-containing protein [Planctomycetota bacterium]
MSEAILEATNRILQALGGNGVSSVKELSRETGLKPREVERAIGWLAREKKIRFVQTEGKEQVSLSGE